MEERLQKIENDIGDLKQDVRNIENILIEMRNEMKIMNNTMTGIFNVGFESLKAVAVQKSVMADMSISYQKAYEKMNELKAV